MMHSHNQPARQNRNGETMMLKSTATILAIAILSVGASVAHADHG